MGCVGRSRGQSAVVGYILVIGLSLAVVGVVVAVGAVAIADVEESAQASQAEAAMTQFDSSAAEVALGESPKKSVRLGQHGGSGSVYVDEGAGEITVTWIDENETEVPIAEEQFGKVVYESGDRTVAYQGGGVWRAENGWSKMVSPPEYHYRDRTLTFPMVKVEGDTSGASPGDQITVSESDFDRHFPNETHTNPLEGGHVHVEVTSDYHYGWKEFFETRTDGSVTHDPDNRTVWVNLTVPFQETFEHGVATTDEDGVEDRHNSIQGEWAEGVYRPSVSPQIDDQIDYCETEDCKDLSDAVESNTIQNGTYYADEDESFEDITFDTTSGDIDLVVDGDVTLDDADIDGDGLVTFYVRGDVTISGNAEMNTDEDPENLLVLVHSSNTTVSISGNSQLTGFIYAPYSEATLDGGGEQSPNIQGALVIESVDFNGNPSDLVYSGGASLDFEIDNDEISSITYLHVTENRVEVTAD
ncbi:putative pilin/flagellin [Halalkaliarchaeum sp. AArc-CO]|nr:putative pilin/flagellin [Halalkaliarchaeum sp. AArc-CO]